MAFSDSESSSSCSDPSDDWENDIVETPKPKSSSSTTAKKDEAKGGIKLDIGQDKPFGCSGAPPSKSSTTTKTTSSSSGFGSSSKSSGFGNSSKSSAADPFAKLFETSSKPSTTSSTKANPFSSIPMAGTKSTTSSTKTTTSSPPKTTTKSPPKPAARKKVVCKQLTIEEDWVQKALKKDHDYSAENSTNYFIEHALDLVENGCKEFAKFVARVQVNEFIDDYGPDYDDMAQGQLQISFFFFLDFSDDFIIYFQKLF
ncbi:Oidioi.mRNA.OKI2018_I69.XSR.g16858.t1.cds [Oikopleura dioica]|uniref:Oidioi.mRNA.OKI2018_I69.XSR.g16858.t1.cds n=1 Tax=Oikopleura dioica TaxID=34765 RepID=A0ABN7SM60_OIKDI|nr:Oidioi.mRNA.OKI2018_I69.XSR.g16858.t1.cds [Oikopleura dioica]